MANRLSISSRQTLGPPAEMPFVPFPFEELASGLGAGVSRDTSKFTSPGEVKPKEGLLNVNAAGFDIPVSDQAILNSHTQNKEQQKQDIVNSIYQNPNDPLMMSKIMNFKNTWQNEENYGDTAKILRNKEQVDLFDKATSGKYNNPWTTIGAQEKQLAYAIAQKKGEITNLDLTSELANLPKEELNRFQAIDNSLAGMSSSEIAGVVDYLGGKNIQTLQTPDGNLLVNVEGQGYSENKVVNTIASRIMAFDFQDDISKQIRYEKLQAELSGQTFDVEARYNQIVNESIKNYAINKKVGYNLTRSVNQLEEGEGKKGLFDGIITKSNIKTIGIFDAKIPEISSSDDKFFDSSGKLSHSTVNNEIIVYKKAMEAIKNSKYKEKEDFLQIARFKAKIQHLESLTDNIFELRNNHKILSDEYKNDKQFINAVKIATNATATDKKDRFKYQAIVPQIQVLSNTIWELAEANPLLWAIKDESTGEIVENTENITREKAAFSLDPVDNRAKFQIGKKRYSMELPDQIVPVFGTIQNIISGVQQSLNTDKMVEIQPFTEFRDEKVIKIKRFLEDRKYKIKVKSAESEEYIDLQPYLSSYIEQLTPKIRKIGQDLVEGTKFK